MIRSRFKTLEGLIQQTVARLKQLSEENRKLRLEINHLHEENGKLENEFHRLKVLGAKQTRIKTKIERIIHKLDKVAG